MADYIKDIRKLIGSIPLVAATASVIILDSKGRILLQLRGDDGMWGLPGGYVEPGETVEEAAKREVMEETGFLADQMVFFGVYSGKELYNKYPNSDEAYFVDTVFVLREYSGVMQADNIESIDLRFFDLAGLPENISPSNIPTLKDWSGRGSLCNELLNKWKI